MISTIYRSWNISDEGAFLCYKPSTIFNSCFSGRFIATIGELCILNYMLIKLKLNKINPNVYHFELLIGVIAELCSWTGCILRNSKFFCIEYMCWNLLLLVLTIFCAKSKMNFIARSFISFILVAVIFFNLFHEIPHFIHYKMEQDVFENTTLFQSKYDKLNPVWHDRMFFFVSYYNVLPLYLLLTNYYENNYKIKNN